MKEQKLGVFTPYKDADKGSESKRDNQLQRIGDTLETLSHQMEALIMITKSQQGEINELNQRLAIPKEHKNDTFKGYI